MGSELSSCLCNFGSHHLTVFLPSMSRSSDLTALCQAWKAVTQSTALSNSLGYPIMKTWHICPFVQLWLIGIIKQNSSLPFMNLFLLLFWTVVGRVLSTVSPNVARECRWKLPVVVAHLSLSRFMVKSQAGGAYSSRQSADISICSRGVPRVRSLVL